MDHEPIVINDYLQELSCHLPKYGSLHAKQHSVSVLNMNLRSSLDRILTVLFYCSIGIFSVQKGPSSALGNPSLALPWPWESRPEHFPVNGISYLRFCFSGGSRTSRSDHSSSWSQSCPVTGSCPGGRLWWYIQNITLFQAWGSVMGGASWCGSVECRAVRTSARRFGLCSSVPDRIASSCRCTTHHHTRTALRNTCSGLGLGFYLTESRSNDRWVRLGWTNRLIFCHFALIAIYLFYTESNGFSFL